jgi:hypothetical protein
MSKYVRKQVLEELISVGQQMSNVLFNVSQDRSIAERYGLQMREVQTEWDSQLRTFRAAQKEAENV